LPVFGDKLGGRTVSVGKIHTIRPCPGREDATLQVRADTDSNDGEVVAEFDLSLAGGTVYTAFAGGYLTPDDESTDEPFDLSVAQDASY